MSARRMRRELVAGGALALSLVACQLIVPGDLPDVKCATASPSSCPRGLECDLAKGVCVAAIDLPDGSDDEDSGADATDGDPTVDGPSGPGDVGSLCVVNGDCKSNVCGTSAVLSSAIVSGNDKPICTSPCCTSFDCTSGFVCFAAGTGGNYCVPADKAGRTPGSAIASRGGTTCSEDSECRSGLCDAGRCIDTCCVPNDCTGGTICRIQGPPTIPHYAWGCALPNGSGSDLGASCTDQVDCKNENCLGIPKICTPSCCTSATCGAQGSEFADDVCSYGETEGDQFKICIPPNQTGSDLGAACGKPSDCKSRFCDPELKECALPCCRDRDCGAGYACRPSADPPPYLRCVRVR